MLGRYLANTLWLTLGVGAGTLTLGVGTAWLVIVAAEMLVGGTGIGYFVWNEWNNLSITNVITSILVIGVVGMAQLPQRRLTAERLRSILRGKSDSAS